MGTSIANSCENVQHWKYISMPTQHQYAYTRAVNDVCVFFVVVFLFSFLYPKQISCWSMMKASFCELMMMWGLLLSDAGLTY